MKLIVTAHGKPGYYEADSLLGILWTLVKHRTMHLIRGGKWED